MQLRLHPRKRTNFDSRKFVIKTILFALIFIIAIFLLDKIEMPVEKKLIKQEISNEQLITVK